MSKLEIVERHSANVTILDLSGKIQIGESSVKLRSSLQELMKKGEMNILLNLAGVSQVDSCGLGEFIAGSASLRRNGGEVKLLNLTDRVNELMVITKLLTVFEVFEVEEKAVNSFQSIPEEGGSSESAFVTGKLDDTRLSH